MGITDRLQTEAAMREQEAWLRGQREALELALNAAPLESSLGVLVRTAADAMGEGSQAAFYLANGDGQTLHHLVGMSAEYAADVDGFQIGPESLACGLATATGQPVLTTDVMEDPRWEQSRWLAERHGYRGCWSFPLHSEAGRFVGTFAVYLRQPRQATPRDLAIASLLTHTASLIISRQRETQARQQAEAALRETEARFRALATVGTSSVYRMSPDWREMRRLDGAGFLADTESPTTAWVDAYIPPDERPRVHDAIEQAIRTKGTFELEHRVLRADGLIGWVLSRAIPLFDATGEITEWFGAVIDLTGRLKATQSFTRLFQASPAPFLVVRPDSPRFTISEVNDAYLNATMRTRAELVGRGIFEAFPDNPGDASIAGVNTLRASLERVLASHQPDTLPGLKYDIARPDGSFEERWWSPVNSAVLGEDGEVEAIIHNANDVTEARRAEAALRESEERLRGVLNSMAEGFALLDGDFTILYVNEETVRLDGRSREELIGRSHWEAFPGTGDSPVGRAFRRVSLERVPVSLEHEYRWPDGRSLWIEMRAYPTGEAGVAVFWRDVTARIEVEAALRASEERLRLALDAGELGAWNADPASGTLQADERFFVIFHGSTSPLTYEQALATIHADDRQRVKDAVAASCRPDDPAPYAEEYRVVHRDGTVHWVFVKGRSTFEDMSDGRRLVSMDGTALDITDRKRQEQEIAAIQRTLYTVVERCPFGIYIIDDDFRIVSMNTGSQDKAFANVRPLIGRPFDEAMRVLWPEPVAAEIVDVFRHTLATGEPYRSQDFVKPRADIGETEGYEWELHRVTLPTGRHGVVCYYYDSTRLRQVERELRETDRRKDEFLATLAHELRNPLAPIRNGLQIMKLAEGDARAVERSRVIMERQVGQMVHLIDDLMDLARVSRGKIVLQKTRLRLVLALQDAVDTVRPLIDERGHELVVDVPTQAIEVDADRTRLAQVFSNLLNNAAKYTERGGRIRVAVERQGSYAVVAVEDNGVGVPAHMLDKVFDMFAQVDHSLEKSQSGLGIGLNIVKKLVEMHDGSVFAESGGHGEGSRFVVRMPVALTGTTDGAGDHHGAAPMARPVRRRILVVDDNRDAATSLATMLGMMGTEAQVAHDGLEAVAAAEALRPDVILLDIGMPKLNGYETCRRIRQQPWSRNTVIVAQTGWGQEGDKQKSKEAGFDFHLVKPVDPAAIEKLLTELPDVAGTADREGFGPDRHLG